MTVRRTERVGGKRQQALERSSQGRETSLANEPPEGCVPIRSLDEAATANSRQRALELVSTLAPAPAERQNIAADSAAHRMIGLDARDTLEEMLASQMIALHSAAIDCIGRAMLPEQEGAIRREELALATRVSRAFAQLAETMDRRRRGGEQIVRVEHVHVHAGGQAVVGIIERGGGRRKPKTTEQSHAQ